ncbi:MAG: glycosyltransferase [Gemmataceae bacterium]|nr:glycosyltransferase [Gemmataceae bacterium]
MRILLAVHQAYTDVISGAARSVRTMMEWFAEAGHECRVLASARFDPPAPADLDAHLADLGIECEAPPADLETPGLRTLCFTLAGVHVTKLVTRHHRSEHPDPVETRLLLNVYEWLLGRFAPQLVVTYGGHPLVLQILRLGKLHGAATLLTLRNHGYDDPLWFQHADHVLTCSPYLSQVYRDSIGLESTGIASPIRWAQVTAPAAEREFVTFVNPTLHKGAALFARLAQVMSERRPDIPFLVVRSAGDGRIFQAFPEISAATYRQVKIGPSTAAPADFLGLTKLLLVPSVFAEPFGRVAVEAMINGIPPLVSNRGALPQTVRDGGLVLPLPEWMTPQSVRLPSVEEVEPWFDTIRRLWDDAAAYERQTRLARTAAERYYSEAASKRRYLEYLDGVCIGVPR